MKRYSVSCTVRTGAGRELEKSRCPVLGCGKQPRIKKFTLLALWYLGTLGRGQAYLWFPVTSTPFFSALPGKRGVGIKQPFNVPICGYTPIYKTNKP